MGIFLKFRFQMVGPCAWYLTNLSNTGPGYISKQHGIHLSDIQMAFEKRIICHLFGHLNNTDPHCTTLILTIISTFSNHFKLLLHFRHCNKMHLQEISVSWFVCVSCDMYFPNETVLHNHRFSVHTEKKSTVDRVHCQFCTITFCRSQR